MLSKNILFSKNASVLYCNILKYSCIKSTNILQSEQSHYIRKSSYTSKIGGQLKYYSSSIETTEFAKSLQIQNTGTTSDTENKEINESMPQPTKLLSILDPEDKNSMDNITPEEELLTLGELCKAEMNLARNISALEPVKNIEAIDQLGTGLTPTFNVSAIVNKSSSLQELVKLGVDLSKYDQDPRKLRFVMSLDFEKDIKPYLLFLHSLDVPPEKWGRLLTINPFIMKEDLDILHTRVKYLQSKNFSISSIARIVASYPLWLSKTIRDVDSRIGFLQQMFRLNGDEVRAVTTKLPRLVFYNKQIIRSIAHILDDDACFTAEQRKELLVSNPRIYQVLVKNLLLKLRLLQDRMMLSNETIVRCNKLLTCSLHRLDNRHFFLKSLGRVQYDPTQPNYICPEQMAIAPDDHFSSVIARSSLHAYNMFLKTL